jgi:hypothetical protein
VTSGSSLITRTAEPLGHLAWFAIGAVGAFLVPFVFSSLIDLQHDLYYLVYFTMVLGYLAAYAQWSRLDVQNFLQRNLWWSLGLGLLAAAFVVTNVISRDSTPHPSGVYFGFEILWRGVVYGAVDALLLSAFPCVVAYAVAGGHLDGIARKAGYGAMAVTGVIVITGVYHLGYEQFREDGIAGPEIGNMAISVPMLLTLNPVGSIVAHSSMHVTAEIHSHETELFLPPKQGDDRSD